MANRKRRTGSGPVPLKVVQVRPRSQITLPPEVLQALGAEVGDYLACEVREGVALLWKAALYPPGGPAGGIWKVLGSAGEAGREQGNHTTGR